MVKMGIVGMVSVREGRRGSNKEKVKEKDEKEDERSGHEWGRKKMNGG